MMIIAICGVDGSGKSTIVKLLASILSSKFNIRVYELNLFIH